MSDPRFRHAIFLAHGPITTRDFDRYGLNYFKTQGISVEAWDVSGGKSILPETRNFSDRASAEQALAALTESDLIFTDTGWQPKTNWIFEAIARGRAPVCGFQTNIIPIFVSRSLIKRIWGLVVNPAAIATKIRRRIPLNRKTMRPVRWIVAGGSASTNLSLFPSGPETETIWAHCLDYDRVLQSDKIEIEKKPFAVFLDEYAPFHPDHQQANEPFPCTPDAYYPALRNFFERVERELCVDVIIASHPASRYDRHPDFFGGRERRLGQTMELVKQAKFVIAHASTALSFANLFEKPILFVATYEMTRHPIFQACRTVASAFGKKPIIIDRAKRIDWNRELTIDAMKYRAYRTTFVKNDGTPDLPSWQILYDYFFSVAGRTA